MRFHIGNICCQIDSRSEGLILKLINKKCPGCSWARPFFSVSLSSFRPNCAFGRSTHASARRFPTRPRFLIPLLPLNSKRCFPTPTDTRPHGNIHRLCSDGNISSQECAPRGGGGFDMNVWEGAGRAVSSVGNKGGAITNYSAPKAEVFTISKALSCIFASI